MEKKVYYQKKNPREEKKRGGSNDQKVYVRKNNGAKPSQEPGFLGDPESWFNDDEFRKQVTADLAYKENQDYYFGSYSHFYIHEEMLKDTVRTLTYQRAIEDNKEDFKDKVVLDLGAGTGILSIFAARAGAKHVYAIENAEIANFAQAIIKQNGFEDKITVIKGKMEEIELPVPQVDIIISEWMGYFLLYESMLDSILYARDKYLAPDGKLLPDRAQIFIASIEDEQYKNQKIGFWQSVYGVDMSCLATAAMKEPLVDSVDGSMINSSTCQVLDLNLKTMKKEEVEFANEYSIRINRDDKVHAIVAWFDVQFSNLQHPVTLSTSPFKKYTHWKQVVFYLDHDLKVVEGDWIHGSIAVRKSRTNFRELDLKISYNIDGEMTQKSFVQMYKLR